MITVLHVYVIREKTMMYVWPISYSIFLIFFAFLNSSSVTRQNVSDEGHWRRVLTKRVTDES